VKRSASKIALALAVIMAVVPLAQGAGPVVLKTTEFGSGPTIVLVHGLGQGRLSWMPTARKLLSNYHVVMVDLPGHGDSPLPDPFSLEASADALDLVIAKQKPDSTLLVGCGVGGLLAMMSASAHPAHQRGLVMIDVALKSPVPIEDQQKKMFYDFMEQNYDQVLHMTFGRMGRDSAQSVAIHAMASQVPPNTMKAYFRSLLDVDGTKALKELKTPMLPVFTEKLLASDKDWPTLSKQIGWENAVAYTPRRIAGAGMLVATEQPDTLAALLAAFATQVLGAAKK
jgi:pimeloyl-ACP methyl ester carboxylesterase